MAASGGGGRGTGGGRTGGGRTGGIAVLVGGRFAWLLLQVVSLAVYFRVLGETLYGIAVIVGLYRGYMKLLDLEIPSGALQRLSATFARDEGRAWRLFRTTLAMQLGVAGAGAVLLALGPHLAPISAQSRAYPALGVLFSLAACQHVTDTLSSTLSLPYLARERFRQLALFESALPMTFTAITATLVLVFRSPVALLAGTAAESLAGLLLKGGMLARAEGLSVLMPRLEAPLAREVLGVGWRVYLTNLSSKIGSTVDKLIIEPVLGPGAMAVYNLAGRIPQVMLETFTRLSEAITPNMARVAEHEPALFGALLRKNVLTVTTVASAGIVAIGGLGTPLVQAWLRKSDPAAGLVVLLMALYYGLEQHFSTMTRGFYARNRILWMLPFTLWNTSVTLLLTAFFARRFGIVGVAGMNLGIDLVQIVPITWITVRVLAPDIAFRPFLLRTAGILGAAFGVALVFFALTRGVPLGAASFAWLPLAWAPGAIVLALLLGTGLGMMPDAVWNRLPARLARFRPASV